VKRGGDRAKRPLETRTPGPKTLVSEVRREGERAAHGEFGYSSMSVPWWWMLTMNSHGVEISIARCVREMVRDPNPMSFFFFFFFFFFYHVLCINKLRGQRLRAALAMVKGEPLPYFHPAPGKKPSIQVSLVRDQPHASRAK